MREGGEDGLMGWEGKEGGHFVVLSLFLGALVGHWRIGNERCKSVGDGSLISRNTILPHSKLI